MPDHIPGWQEAAQAEWRRRAKELGLQAPMPAHRIAARVITIQLCLFVIGLMIAADLAHFGVYWLNFVIAVVALGAGFEEHRNLWRGR